MSQALVDLIGHTPVISARDLLGEAAATISLKLEKFNVCGSVKDRAALHIVRRALELGLIAPGGMLIESSSGNLGIALSFMAAIAGLKAIIIVDPKSSPQNVAIMRAYGAEVVVEDRLDSTGNYHETRIERARELQAAIPGSYWVNQTANPLNAEAHELSTAQEIIDEFGGEPGTVVVPVSSCGQVAGIARALRNAIPAVRVVAVDIAGSRIFSTNGACYAIPGMGLAWRPTILDVSTIDEVYTVTDDMCVSVVRHLARCGLLIGPSSGAVVLAALAAAHRQSGRSKVLGLLADGGERYMDTVFSDKWVVEKGLLVDASHAGVLAMARSLVPQLADEHVASAL